TIYPDFFHTIGTPLIAGRDFTAADNASSSGVVIVNERLASLMWPGESPIGKRLRLTGANEPLLEVVGVARDGKYHELTENQAAFLYVPAAQGVRYVFDMALVARTAGAPE